MYSAVVAQQYGIFSGVEGEYAGDLGSTSSGYYASCFRFGFPFAATPSKGTSMAPTEASSTPLDDP